jgi:hypothetical protein
MPGCCIPRDCDPSKKTNKMINDALERDRKEMKAESKLLLLGKKDFFILIRISFFYYFKVLQNPERVR